MLIRNAMLWITLVSLALLAGADDPRTKDQAQARPKSSAAPTSKADTSASKAKKTEPSKGTKPSATSRADAEPRMLSAEETAKRSSGLKALSLENPDDRYDSTNWAEVPPWRQTSFYGVRAKGQTFIYVVDCSGSMGDDGRMTRAKRELRRSVMSLQFPQRFKVIFYNDEPVPMPGDIPKSADGLSKDQFLAWLRLIEPDGMTDPRLAVKIALGLKPDAVFLLSDGAFPDGAAKDIITANRRKIPIHCIDLSGGAGGEQMKQIADASGGRYVARP